MRLSNAQKRLLNALTREPTSHLYSRAWQKRHYLTSGGTRSALRRLIRLQLIVEVEGTWRLADPGMEKWWKAVLGSPSGSDGAEAIELQSVNDGFTIPPELLELCHQLKEAQDRAKKLGIFVYDRELVICPRCGLSEDISFSGALMTCKADDPTFSDTGLKFTFQGDICRCPDCGHEFRVEENAD